MKETQDCKKKSISWKTRLLAVLFIAGSGSGRGPAALIRFWLVQNVLHASLAADWLIGRTIFLFRFNAISPRFPFKYQVFLSVPSEINQTAVSQSQQKSPLSVPHQQFPESLWGLMVLLVHRSDITSITTHLHRSYVFLHRTISKIKSRCMLMHMSFQACLEKGFHDFRNQSTWSSPVERFSKASSLPIRERKRSQFNH